MVRLRENYNHSVLTTQVIAFCLIAQIILEKRAVIGRGLPCRLLESTLRVNAMTIAQ